MSIMDPTGLSSHKWLPTDEDYKAGSEAPSKIRSLPALRALTSPDLGSPSVYVFTSPHKQAKRADYPLTGLSGYCPWATPYKTPQHLQLSADRQKGKSQPGTGRDRAFDSLAAYSVLTFEPGGIRVGLE